MILLKKIKKFKDRNLKRLSFAYRILTSNSRQFPNFMIIGVQKGGTTSLYEYLIQHNNIAASFKKEVHYFNLNNEKSMNWYKAFFPRKSEKDNLISVDASPYYFFHPSVPERISKVFPNMKFVLLLRNPIDRAYSHYQHNVRRGLEKLSFEDAIAQESMRLEGEREMLLKNPSYTSVNFQRYSYLSRGLYNEQLLNWYTYFPREKFLILSSEVFYSEPEQSLREVYQFLGIEYVKPADLKVFNSGGDYRKISKDTLEYLRDYFKPFNKELYKLTGNDYGWDAE